MIGFKQTREEEMNDKVSESLSKWSLYKARDDIKNILNDPCWDNPQPVTSEEWITDKMNNEDRVDERQDAIGRMILTNECLWESVLPRWQEDLLKRASKLLEDK